MIPDVAGPLACTLAELENRLLLRIAEQSADGDNALLSVLCDAVRLCREYSSAAPKPLSYREGVIVGRRTALKALEGGEEQAKRKQIRENNMIGEAGI